MIKANYRKRKIAIVIPVHNRKKVTLKCLDALDMILETDFYSATIVIVDDGSIDGTADAVKKKYINTTLLKGDGNLWWAGSINKGINHALKEAFFDFILLMNDDISFKPDFINILLKSALCNDNSIVGAITLYSTKNNVIWKAGMIDTKKIHPLLVNNFQNKLYDNSLPELIEVDAISGRAVLIPVSVFQKIGLFDDNKFPHGYADHDFCIRAKKCRYTLLINTKALIYSEPGDNKSFFYLLPKLKTIKFLKTFADIKYDWNLNSLFHIYIRSRSLPKALSGFSVHILILFKWIMLKHILPLNFFNKILAQKFHD